MFDRVLNTLLEPGSKIMVEAIMLWRNIAFLKLV